MSSLLNLKLLIPEPAIIQVLNIYYREERDQLLFTVKENYEVMELWTLVLLFYIFPYVSTLNVHI